MSRRGFATYMEYERGFHGWLVFLAAVPLELASYVLLAVQRSHYQSSNCADVLWGVLRGGGLLSIALFLIWALYWMRSKRVRLTYGANAFARATDNALELSRRVI